MPIQTPICDFGQKAHSFELKSTDNKILSLNDVKGENGTLIMFICNHCPYVKAVTKEIGCAHSIISSSNFLSFII